MPMGCIKCSREDLRQESPRPVERASRGRAGLLHVLPGNRRGLWIVLHSDKLAIVVERASEPCARVSDRGAELEDPARADRAREDVEETSLRRGDDWPAFLFALLFHGPQGRV